MAKDKIKQQVIFSDDEIRERLTKRFEALEIMSDATVTGKNRSLIVSGPAGLGKSYTVEQTVIKNADKVNSITKIGRAHV